MFSALEVGEEIVLAHVFGVPLGGYREGVREDEGRQTVFLAVAVDEPQKPDLLGIVGGVVG